MDRTTIIRGLVDDAPIDEHDAATSILVMHFLKDDGAKSDYLKSIRNRLRKNAVYVHVDVCFADRSEFETTVAPFLKHAELAGLSSLDAERGPALIRDLPVVFDQRTRGLLTDAGFTDVANFFRGLWYSDRLCRAA